MPRHGRGGEEGGIGAYRGASQLLAALTVALGVLMIAVTAWRGGGVGLALGALFVLAGGGRLWLLRRR